MRKAEGEMILDIMIGINIAGSLVNMKSFIDTGNPISLFFMAWCMVAVGMLVKIRREEGKI